MNGALWIVLLAALAFADPVPSADPAESVSPPEIPWSALGGVVGPFVENWTVRGCNPHPLGVAHARVVGLSLPGLANRFAQQINLHRFDAAHSILTTYDDRIPEEGWMKRALDRTDRFCNVPTCVLSDAHFAECADVALPLATWKRFAKRIAPATDAEPPGVSCDGTLYAPTTDFNGVPLYSGGVTQEKADAFMQFVTTPRMCRWV